MTGGGVDNEEPAKGVLGAVWKFVRPHTIRGTLLGTTAIVTRQLLQNPELFNQALVPKALMGLLALLLGGVGPALHLTSHPTRTLGSTSLSTTAPMDPAFSKHAGSAPPFRVTLSPGRDMEGTSYESRFFIYEGGDDDLASRIAMVLWLFEDELGRAALEALQKDEIVLYTREGVKIEHCSYLRPNDELLVSVRAAAVKKISQRASQRTSTREESAGASTDDDERAAELLPAQGGVGAPRVVTCSFFVNNMKKVDAIEGTVELDFQLYAQWVDPALAGVPVEERPPYREEDRRADDNRPLCWNPKLEVNNDVNLETLWSVFPPAYQGVEEGRVVWGARYRGALPLGDEA